MAAGTGSPGPRGSSRPPLRPPGPERSGPFSSSRSRRRRPPHTHPGCNSYVPWIRRIGGKALRLTASAAPGVCVAAGEAAAAAAAAPSLRPPPPGQYRRPPRPPPLPRALSRSSPPPTPLPTATPPAACLPGGLDCGNAGGVRGRRRRAVCRCGERPACLPVRVRPPALSPWCPLSPSGGPGF